MDGASMTVDLQADDYAAFTVYAHQQPELRRRRWAGHKRFAVIMVVGMLVLMLAQSWNGGNVDWAALLPTYTPTGQLVEGFRWATTADIDANADLFTV